MRERDQCSRVEKISCTLDGQFAVPEISENISIYLSEITDDIASFIQILQFRFFKFRLLGNYRDSRGKLTVFLW